MQQWLTQWGQGLTQSAQAALAQAPGLVGLTHQQISSIAFGGMGGSGIAGRLVKLLIGARSSLPVTVIEGARLPFLRDEHTLVVLSSYSGNTWEALELFEQCLARRLPMVVIASGGALLQRARESGVPVLTVPTGWVPRAALPLFLGTILGLLEYLGLYDGFPLVTEWAAHWREMQATVSDRRRYQTVCSLLSTATFCHVWGASDDSDAVAYRLQTQLNENSKIAAVCSVLPELNHNLLVGFDAFETVITPVAPIVCLMTDFAPRLLSVSYASVESTLAARGILLYKPELFGDTWESQLAYALWWADFASLYVGQARGCNITQTRLIDAVKRTFSKEVHANEKKPTSSSA